MSDYFDDPGRIGRPDSLSDWSDELDDDSFWDDDPAQLEDHGGYCDCEVLLNVLPTCFGG